MSKGYALSPKGFFVSRLKGYGLSFEEADEIWCQFEGFCAKKSTEHYGDSEFPALVFDGAGGEVIGVDTQPQGESYED